MGELISIDGREFAITAVSMGNPHAVIFTNDVQQIPLEQIGPKIERNPLFPARTNVHFVEVHSDNEITMRTWERGARRSRSPAELAPALLSWHPRSTTSRAAQ